MGRVSDLQKPKVGANSLSSLFDDPNLSRTIVERNCNIRPVHAFLKKDLAENENSSAIAMFERSDIDLYSLPTDMTLVPYEDQLIESTKTVWTKS